MIQNDNEYYYAALTEWIDIDREHRGNLTTGELKAEQWSEILQIAQQLKSSAHTTQKKQLTAISVN